MHLPPHSPSSSHIKNALTMAGMLGATGVLSGVHYTTSGKAIGFIYGHALFENERLMRTSTIIKFNRHGVRTETGNFYVIADHRDEHAAQDRERLMAALDHYRLMRKELRMQSKKPAAAC